jgi:hypothetical protein
MTYSNTSLLPVAPQFATGFNIGLATSTTRHLQNASWQALWQNTVHLKKNFTCRVRQSAFTTCTACPLPPNRHDSTLSIPCSAVDRFTDFMKHHRSVLAQWETGPFRAIPYLLCYPGSSSRPAQSCAFPYRPARWHKGHSTKVTKGAPRYPKRQQAPASAGRSSCPTCAGGSIKRVCSIGPQTTGTRHKEDLAPPGNRTPTSSVGGMNPNH